MSDFQFNWNAAGGLCVFVQRHSPGIARSCIVMLSWADNIERYLTLSGCFLSVKFYCYVKEAFVFLSLTHFPSCSNLVNWMLPILFVAVFRMSTISDICQQNSDCSHKSLFLWDIISDIFSALLRFQVKTTHLWKLLGSLILSHAKLQPSGGN